jgi:hypothetical protein
VALLTRLANVFTAIVKKIFLFGSGFANNSISEEFIGRSKTYLSRFGTTNTCPSHKKNIKESKEFSFSAIL